MMNVERMRPIYEQKAYMSVEGSHPIASFYFGIFEQSTLYERYDYDMIAVLGNTGGLADAVLILSIAIVLYFMSINQNIRKIFTFVEILKQVPDYVKYKRIESLKTWKFYSKLFCFGKHAIEFWKIVHGV